jgi:hypothetical protein
MAFSGQARAADPVDAGALFDQGVADLQAGRYDRACPAIAESYRLDPRAGTLFTLADCEAKRGWNAAALTHYDAYLTRFSGMDSTLKANHRDREAIARAQRTVLLPLVAQLTLLLPATAPKDTVIRCDGALVGAVTLGIAMPFDPGSHVVTTQAPGGELVELPFTLEKGEKRSIDLEVKLPRSATPKPLATPPVPRVPLAVPLPSSPVHRVSARRVASYAIGAVGLAGLVVGGVTGGLALGKQGAISKGCVDQGPSDAVCTHDGKLAADSARPLEVASTISFAAGAVALGVATVLFLTEPTRPGGRGVVPGAPRVSLDVDLFANQAGAQLGLSGTW